MTHLPIQLTLIRINTIIFLNFIPCCICPQRKNNIVFTQKYFFILTKSADAKTFITTQQGERSGKDGSILLLLYRLEYHAINFHELSSFAFQSLFHYVSVFFSPCEDEWMLNLIKQKMWSVLSRSKTGPLDLTA